MNYMIYILSIYFKVIMEDINLLPDEKIIYKSLVVDPRESFAGKTNLYITNLRLVFSSDKDHFEIPFDRITEVPSDFKGEISYVADEGLTKKLKIKPQSANPLGFSDPAETKFILKTIYNEKYRGIDTIDEAELSEINAHKEYWWVYTLCLIAGAIFGGALGAVIFVGVGHGIMKLLTSKHAGVIKIVGSIVLIILGIILYVIAVVIISALLGIE